MTCPAPMSWGTLLAYWLGELDPDREAHTEEHYLGCSLCSARLEQLVSLVHEVRALTGASGVNFVLNEAFVRRLEEQGRRVREYHVPRNGAVNCTVTSEDEFVIARLEVPLAGMKRVDLVYVDPQGKTGARQEDIPFVANSGGVLFSTPVAVLRALPETVIRVRLLAVDERGERALGEYTFNHSPSPAQSSDGKPSE